MILMRVAVEERNDPWALPVKADDVVSALLTGVTLPAFSLPCVEDRIHKICKSPYLI